MRRTLGLLLAVTCFIVYAVGEAPVAHRQSGSGDFPMAGFFLGLAVYTGSSRRRVLGLFLGGVTLLFGFLGLNTWLLLGLWLGAVVMALCGLHDAPKV